MLENISLVKKKQSKFTKKSKKIKKELEDNSIVLDETQSQKKRKLKANTRSVVYIGHIPHGFYEEEMKNYFKQFGKVARVIVCRSRKTGQSKGFGFVQFVDNEVAKVAAETMDNYLMFKRRLIAKYIPPEKVKPKMLRSTFFMSDAHEKYKNNRQEQLLQKNNEISPEKIKTNAETSLKKFNLKRQKLEALGINVTLKPIDLPKELTVTNENKESKKMKPKEKKVKEASPKKRIPEVKTEKILTKTDAAPSSSLKVSKNKPFTSKEPKVVEKPSIKVEKPLQKPKSSSTILKKVKQDKKELLKMALVEMMKNNKDKIMTRSQVSSLKPKKVVKKSVKNK